MTEPVFAPGPWIVGDDGEIYSVPSQGSVAMVLLNEYGEANARVIAAVPDLIAALRDIADQAEGRRMGGNVLACLAHPVPRRADRVRDAPS